MSKARYYLGLIFGIIVAVLFIIFKNKLLFDLDTTDGIWLGIVLGVCTAEIIWWYTFPVRILFWGTLPLRFIHNLMDSGDNLSVRY